MSDDVKRYNVSVPGHHAPQMMRSSDGTQACSADACQWVKASEYDKLKDQVSIAYGYLWHVNNEPGTPGQYSPERAAYAARKILREFFTSEDRGTGINKARELIQKDAS